MSDIFSLPGIVEKAFDAAVIKADYACWRSLSIMAGCVAVRLAAEGQLFHAACMEGVADEARHQMALLMPKGLPCRQ